MGPELGEVAVEIVKFVDDYQPGIVACELVDADFYGASLPGSRFYGCDLNGVELSKSDLAGSRLHHSRFERLRGAEALRSVTIGSDQIIPTALAVFAAFDIHVSDDDP